MPLQKIFPNMGKIFRKNSKLFENFGKFMKSSEHLESFREIWDKWERFRSFGYFKIIVVF